MLVLWLTSMVSLAALPQPTGPINDFAGVLSEEQEAELTSLARDLERATTAELAVAVVTSLEGMSIEAYAVRLFAEWGIGQRATDNGVLVLVAPNDRAMRIEVGYGLESVLPDGLAGEVIRTVFIPRFRENDYGAGIMAGTRRIADIVRRDDVLTDEQRAAYARANADMPSDWFIVPFLGLFVGIGFLFIGLGLGSRTLFGITFGAVFGGVGLVLGLILATKSGLTILGGIGGAATLLGVLIGRTDFGSQGMRGTGASTGWVWGQSGSGGGGSRGWSGGSSGSSGGGFGGGRSGGGGASGRW
jgi:uncharacterized protein